MSISGNSVQKPEDFGFSAALSAAKQANMSITVNGSSLGGRSVQVLLGKDPLISMPIVPDYKGSALSLNTGRVSIPGWISSSSATVGATNLKKATAMINEKINAVESAKQVVIGTVGRRLKDDVIEDSGSSVRNAVQDLFLAMGIDDISENVQKITKAMKVIENLKEGAGPVKFGDTGLDIQLLVDDELYVSSPTDASVASIFPSKERSDSMKRTSGFASGLVSRMSDLFWKNDKSKDTQRQSGQNNNYIVPRDRSNTLDSNSSFGSNSYSDLDSDYGDENKVEKGLGTRIYEDFKARFNLGKKDVDGQAPVNSIDEPHNAELEQTNQVVDVLNSSSKMLNRKCFDVCSSVNSMCSTLMGLVRWTRSESPNASDKQNTSKIESQIKALKKDAAAALESITNKLNNELDSINNKKAKVDSLTAGLNQTNVKSLQQQAAEKKKESESLERAAGEKGTEVSSLQTNLFTKRNVVNVESTRVQENINKAKKVEDDVALTRKRADQTQGEKKKVEGSITATQGKVANLNAVLSELEAEDVGVEAVIKNVLNSRNASITKLEGDKKGLESKILSLQTKQKLLSDNKSAIDSVTEGGRLKIRDLQQQISALTQEIGVISNEAQELKNRAQKSMEESDHLGQTAAQILVSRNLRIKQSGNKFVSLAKAAIEDAKNLAKAAVEEATRLRSRANTASLASTQAGSEVTNIKNEHSQALQKLERCTASLNAKNNSLVELKTGLPAQMPVTPKGALLIKITAISNFEKEIEKLNSEKSDLEALITNQSQELVVATAKFEELNDVATQADISACTAEGVSKAAQEIAEGTFKALQKEPKDKDVVLSKKPRDLTLVAEPKVIEAPVTSNVNRGTKAQADALRNVITNPEARLKELTKIYREQGMQEEKAAENARKINGMITSGNVNSIKVIAGVFVNKSGDSLVVSDKKI